MKSQLLLTVAALALVSAPVHAETAPHRHKSGHAATKPAKKHVAKNTWTKTTSAKTTWREQPATQAAAPKTPDLAAAVLAGDPIVFHGVRIYGALDFGGGWQSHSATFNGNYPQGVEYAIGKNSNKAGFVAAPGGLGYNNIGLKGAESLFSAAPLGEVKAVFDFNTSFDPYSVALSNGAQSLRQNNGTTSAQLGNSSANGDSARNGQPFNDYAYGGFSSSTLGTLTFGRQRLFSTDDYKASDPFNGALAFSLLGYSSSLNGGATEATRLNNALKYVYAYGPYHAGAMVQLGEFAEGEHGGKGSYQFNIGADLDNFSIGVDAGHVSGATTLSYYSSAVWAGNQNLADYLSDNDMVLVGAKYKYQAFTFFGGYEWFKVSNPSATVANGSYLVNPDGFGGYAYTNVYVTPKIEQLAWTGLKYAYNAQLDLILGYSHLWQNAYAAKNYAKSATPTALTKNTAYAACATTAASNCSGAEDAVSFAVDYHYTRNLEFYAGAMFTSVSNGLASGYLAKTEWDPTVGLRYTF